MTGNARLVLLCGGCIPLGAWLCLSADARAEGINVAADGTGILGIAAVDDGTRGMDHSQYGGTANVNDGSITTRAQTWTSGYASYDYDWVGVEFAAPLDAITSVRVVNATFRDGGWWGPADPGPGAGGTLLATDLFAPKVQVTHDGGVTWNDVAGVTDDYVTALTGHILTPNPSTSPFATFQFARQDSVDGIRLLGVGGGVAGGDTSGFIGIFEFEAYQIPEPSTFVLLGSGLAVAIGLARRRRKR